MTDLTILDRLHEQGSTESNEMEKAILKFGAVRQELEAATAKVASQQQAIYRLTAELDAQREINAALLRERNFYMTHSVRLTTQLDSIASAARSHAEQIGAEIARARAHSVNVAIESNREAAAEPVAAVVAEEPAGDDAQEDDDGPISDDEARAIAQRFAPRGVVIMPPDENLPTQSKAIELLKRLAG